MDDLPRVHVHAPAQAGIGGRELAGVEQPLQGAPEVGEEVGERVVRGREVECRDYYDRAAAAR